MSAAAALTAALATAQAAVDHAAPEAEDAVTALSGAIHAAVGDVPSYEIRQASEVGGRVHPPTTGACSTGVAHEEVLSALVGMGRRRLTDAEAHAGGPGLAACDDGAGHSLLVPAPGSAGSRGGTHGSGSVGGGRDVPDGARGRQRRFRSTPRGCDDLHGWRWRRRPARVH